MGTLIRNIRLLGSSSADWHLRFEDARIATRSTSEVEARDGDIEVDGGHKLAIPGFINAHTHLAMVLLRGLADDVPLQAWLEEHIWPVEQQLTPEDIYWCTLLGIAEGIRSGTTAFIDMYFHVDEIARAVEESGVRALLSQGIVASSLQDEGQQRLSKTESLIRQWHGQANHRIQISVAPHAVYTCNEDVLRRAVELAHKYHTSMHIHVSETRTEVEEWKTQTGKTPVAYLEGIDAFSIPTLAAHCVHVEAADLPILAERPITVAHCPKSNAKLGSGIAPVPEMRRAGVCVALGTDGAASNNRMDMIEEIRAAWMIQRAMHEDPSLMPAHEAVSMAIHAARPIFGLPEDALSEGAPADVVLLDTDRVHTTPMHDSDPLLAYAANAADVTDVYVDGKALLKNGELHTIDEERVKSEVQRLLHRIRNR